MKTGRFIVVIALVGLSTPAVGQAGGDDDIVRLAGATWRLHGIDLPGPDQVCADGWRAGEAARAALRNLARDGKLACRNTAKDQFSRPVASCEVDGEDLGTILVRQGMAWASLRHTWRYMLDDWIAWYRGAGVYGHKCEKPSDWRASHRGRG